MTIQLKLACVRCEADYTDRQGSLVAAAEASGARCSWQTLAEAMPRKCAAVRWASAS